MIATIRFLACGLLLLAVRSAAAGPHEPIAILYQVSGEALHIAPGSPRPLRLFDRLPAGAVVDLPPGSRLALAFITGKRYEITGPARVTLGKGDLAIKSGGVRALPSVPSLLLLSPIAESERPGSTAGAVRIRSEVITGLYPHCGAAVLAEEARLHFQPVTGAREYRIEVQDGQSRTVFQADTESSPVKVPAGMLQSGHRYWWTVHTLDRPGAVARGGAELVTLGADAARAREKAREVLEAEGPGSLPLLAEIDRSLGLLREAREDLRTALESAPSDPALREALAELEMQLEDKNDQD